MVWAVSTPYDHSTRHLGRLGAAGVEPHHRPCLAHKHLWVDVPQATIGEPVEAHLWGRKRLVQVKQL